MQEEIRKGISIIQPGPQRLCDCMGRFIFKASLAAILNECAANDTVLFDAFNAFDGVMPLLLAGMPSFLFPEFVRNRVILADACAKYNQSISEFMERRYQYLMDIEQKGGMLPGDTAKTQLAIFWASVGNTMPGTFWMLFYLLKNTACLNKVKEEINNEIPHFASDVDARVSFDELNRLVYLDACITEALRLSSGSLIMRSCYRPCSITMASGNKFSFRKDDRIGLCPPVLHRDEEIYPNALAFVPERWMLPLTDVNGRTYELQERINAAQGKIPLFKQGKEVPSSSVFLAFGAGVSHCPGRRFARNELKCLLVYILSRLELSLVDQDVKMPKFLASRAGIGIFPPAEDVLIDVKIKTAM